MLKRVKNIVEKVNNVLTYIIGLALIYLAVLCFTEAMFTEGLLILTVFGFNYILKEWKTDKTRLRELEVKGNDSKIKDLEINALKAQVVSNKVLDKSKDIVIKNLERQVREYGENENNLYRLIEDLLKHFNVNSLGRKNIDKVINLARKQLIKLAESEEE